MKKIINLLFILLFLMFQSAAFAKKVSIYDDYPKNKAVYKQYIKDIHDDLKANIDNKKVFEVLTPQERWDDSISFLITINSDGTINRCERYQNGDILQEKNTAFYKFAYEFITKQGLKPFYKGMNVDKVMVNIDFRWFEYGQRTTVYVGYIKEFHGVLPRFLLHIIGPIPVPSCWVNYDKLLLFWGQHT